MRAFDLQGHRGARGLFPENTLEGFRAALAVGVETFELDVGLTADGVVVVHHDPALNPDVARGPDGIWLKGPTPRLLDLTTAELARYDVGRLRPGSFYAARYRDQMPADGARIPRLADVLRIDAGVRFNIEMKTDPRRPGLTPDPASLADAVMAEVDAAGVLARVTVESFDWRGPRHLRTTRPEVRLAWLTSPATVADAGRWWGGPHPGDFGGSVVRAVAAEHGRGLAADHWAPDHKTLTEAAVQEAHALGLAVLPWTVNRPRRMRRLIDWGVDGLITDRPDLARVVLREAGLPMPQVRREPGMSVRTN
jgi:glycerophosphoryl diester phosphodiesterase